jgi:HEAT repeat protein
MQGQMQDTIQQLGSHDLKRRNEAAQTLIQTGAPAAEPLVAALSNDNLHLETVFRVLRQLGEPAVPPLIAALADNSDGKRQQRAAHILGQMRDSRAVDPMIAALQDDDAPVREEAVIALRTLGDPRALPPLFALLASGDEGLRTKIAWVLGDFGGDAVVDALLAHLDDPEPQVRRGVVWSLGKLSGERVVEALNHALNDPDGDVKHFAKLGLDKIAELAKMPLVGSQEKPSSDSLPAVISLDALRHSNPQIRVQVVQMIVRQGGASNVHVLLMALDDINPGVQKAVIEALVKIGEPAAQPLINALGSKNRVLRAEAARTLGIMKEPRAVEPVIGLLHDDQRGVRIAAAEALGNIGDKRAIPPLTARLSETDPEVLAAVESALQQLGQNPNNLAGSVRKLMRGWNELRERGRKKD